ncbi:MAG: CRTAC1 family protein [Anaerolineae bacterium]|nr:CRTAC1 family protein [Anaerolineae bacterium]
MFFVYAVSISAQDVPVTVEYISPPDTTLQCSGQFVAHTLDHVTTVPSGQDVRQFEANGSGLAINDLDNDGDLDVVLGNHAGMNTILWNEGDLDFRTERLDFGMSRGVNIIDIDADGWNDLFFTRIASAPNYYRNQGDGTFMLEVLPYIAEPLYSTSWADLDYDGDLDLVGGTYDAELLNTIGQEFMLSGRGGVYYYENDAGYFRPQRLAQEAQALALILADTNEDGRLDIVVGNDFAVPDYIWLNTENGWVSDEYFENTTYSTMSYDFGDLNNDGTTEFFSTDMKPYATDDTTTAAWQPLMDDMMDDPHPVGDPQVMQNVLQVTSADGFLNRATGWGIDATGWSWSSKFGDLDQDGFLDLYIVNGFIEQTMFAHLPQHELVEENQAFRNRNGQGFQPMPGWGLASTYSGRAMSMADLDGDGDLDIVVNNLRGPAQLFENQLCSGRSLEVDLHWPNSENPSAIGSRVTLVTKTVDMQRMLRSSSGYLSGDPSRLHFGYPASTNLLTLEITWPDGAHSTIDLAGDEAMLVIRR